MTESVQFPSVEQLGGHASDRIKAHFGRLFARYSGGSYPETTPGCFQLMTGEPHPLGNFCIIEPLVPASVVAQCIAPLCLDQLPTAAILHDGDHREHVELLAQHGFVHGEHLPMMSVTPDQLAQTTLPDGYTLEEINASSDGQWNAALGIGYGLPISLASIFGPSTTDRLGSPGEVQHFAVMHKGEIVATSMVYFHDGLAGIYGVSTIESHRKKGLGAHLTAEPLRRAWDKGYKAGILQGSEMGAPVYTRIGFQTHGTMRLFVRMPS